MKEISYPTTQLTTPPMRLKSRWGCQNHPEASTATSFEGRLGVVGISGQMMPFSAANRGDFIRPNLERGENEEHGGTRKEAMVAIERPISARVMISEITLTMMSATFYAEEGWCSE